MLKSHRQPFTLLLRFTLGLLLVMAVWNPDLPISSEPVDIYVVIDDSLSMPELRIQKTLSRLEKYFSDLPKGSQIALLRYASKTVIEVPLTAADKKSIRERLTEQSFTRHQTLDRTATNTSAAITQVLHLASTKNNSTIILISDGQDTQGDIEQALINARQAGISVFGIPVQSDTTTSSWIESLQLPQHGSVGQPFPITLLIKGSDQQQHSVKLLFNGKQHSQFKFQLSSQGQWQHRWWITADKAGTQNIEVIVDNTDTNSISTQYKRALINIAGNKPILYIAKQTTPLLAQLQQNDINIHFKTTLDFPDRLNTLLNYSSIILDDIAITDLSTSYWNTLTTAVQNHGTGLLLLGGEHAFGQGGYRHSQLESILPVTAEANSRQDSANILFLIDTSGSMDSDASQSNPGASSYIEQARQSVITTANHISSNDSIGLITFDIEAKQRLAIGQYANPKQAIEKAWQYNASGGTQLLTALKAANRALAQTSDDTRLLVLLTDSFIEDTSLYEISEKLKNNKIQLITLVTGNTNKTSNLEKLSRTTGGQLIKINDMFALPQIMREQLEQHRLPIEHGDISVFSKQALPFFISDNWPSINAYNVTRAKPNSSVYLQSDRDDPLMAFQQSGNGRVIVMPGGMSAWQSWPLQKQFMQSLINWLGIQHNPQLFTQSTFSAGKLKIDVDALSNKLDWTVNKSLNNLPASASITDPSGTTTRYPLKQTAAGHFTVETPIHLEGTYTILINVGNQRAVFDTLYTATQEFIPQPGTHGNAKQYFTNLQTDGLMSLWLPSEETTIPLSLTKDSAPTRNLFLLTALLCYLFLLAHERGITARIFKSIKAKHNFNV